MAALLSPAPSRCPLVSVAAVYGSSPLVSALSFPSRLRRGRVWPLFPVLPSRPVAAILGRFLSVSTFVFAKLPAANIQIFFEKIALLEKTNLQIGVKTYKIVFKTSKS